MTAPRAAAIILSVILTACVRPVMGAARTDPRPNILLILADDVGLDLVSCYGADRHRTPNIDALALAGVRFQTCYSTPLCGPSRCQIMTGRYPFRTGGLTNQSFGAGGPSSRTEVSIAAQLKRAGYATGQAGKWRQLGQTPRDWGFDEYCTDPKDVGYYWESSYILNGQTVRLGHQVYMPDIVQQFATDFFQRHQAQPWFFYYASHLVHIPIERTPDSRPGAKERQLYDDNIAYLDKQVGQLVASLGATGQLGNTLIIFAGDNGSAGKSSTIGGRRIFGNKGTMTEGGSRVPLIASWHGVTPPGTVTGGMVDFSDLFPTFIELAGTDLPAGVTIDGRSFASQLRGGPGQRDWIFVQLGGQWYARDAGYELNNRNELFDMADAPFKVKPLPDPDANSTTLAAQAQLQGVLRDLNPAGGKK